MDKNSKNKKTNKQKGHD